MKVLALADPHYDQANRPRAEVIARAICATDADVLIIAGDCSMHGQDKVGSALELFESFDGTRLMVPGNHDLWQHEQPFSTRQVYEEVIPKIAADHGFHCLDRGPALVDNTAFIGVMGWYDYEMRQREAPVDGLTVTPINVSPGDDGKARFRAVEGAGEMQWEELAADDYAANGLIWQAGNATPEVAIWNDALHLDWKRPAPEVAAEMAQRLREQVHEVSGECERVVGVTHFVPFAELAERHLDSPRRAYARAFLGSSLMGEALLEAENLALVIYGHRHHQQVQETQGVVTADAAVSAGAGPLLLTLPD